MNGADELLRRARRLGAIFRVGEGESIHWESPQPLPEHLLSELKRQKPELLALLARPPDYASTACTCSAAIGGTSSDRCGVCGLPLICPLCSLCRGCKLALKFKR
jgi:hypothetical protein